MKLINKHNFISIICHCFTAFTLTIVLSEGFISGFNATHKNILAALFFSFLGTLILSQHTRFEKISPALAIVIEYVIAIIVVITFTHLTSLKPPYHPDRYRDMIRSFSIPYFILATYYYIEVHKVTKKENQVLQDVKKIKQLRSHQAHKED